MHIKDSSFLIYRLLSQALLSEKYVSVGPIFIGSTVEIMYLHFEFKVFLKSYLDFQISRMIA